MHKLQILISASAFVSTHSIRLLYTSQKKTDTKKSRYKAVKQLKKEDKRTEIQTFQQKSGI